MHTTCHNRFCDQLCLWTAGRMQPRDLTDRQQRRHISIQQSLLLYCSPQFAWYCRILYSTYAARRLTEWVPTLKWSEMHHFRDDFEVELCARWESATVWILCTCLSACFSS